MSSCIEKELRLQRLSAVFTKAVQSSVSSVEGNGTVNFRSLPEDCVQIIERMLLGRLGKCEQELKTNFEELCFDKRPSRLTADEMIASSDVALNPCFKLLKYEKDRLIDSIGYVLSGMEELRGKIRYVRSQIDYQVTELDEEEKKIAIASEECN